MSDERVSASNSTLMRQAPMTADVYFQAAVATIEHQFGAGTAQQYPQLVAAHMQASAIDYGASVIARALEAIADRPTDA